MENKDMEENQDSKKNKNIDEKENIAVIRLRGNVTIRKDFEKTMQMLKLYKRNFCVILPKTKAYLGMIEKVKDHVTWGEINNDTLKDLNERRKQDNKKFYRLDSPKGGLGRRGIKAPFKKSGALGYRGDKINDLIRRMI